MIHTQLCTTPHASMGSSLCCCTCCGCRCWCCSSLVLSFPPACMQCGCRCCFRADRCCYCCLAWACSTSHKPRHRMLVYTAAAAAALLGHAPRPTALPRASLCALLLHFLHFLLLLLALLFRTTPITACSYAPLLLLLLLRWPLLLLLLGASSPPNNTQLIPLLHFLLRLLLLLLRHNDPLITARLYAQLLLLVLL